MQNLSCEKQEILERYLDEILKINEQINLTSITDLDEARLLHLEDSLTALPEIEAAPDGEYCDMGCGGGFPGVPLAVASGRKTTLIDSRNKKIEAVKQAISKAGCDKFADFYCKAARVEDFAKEQARRFSVVSARALSSLPTLLELASPLLKTGGHLVCLKGQVDEEELAWAKSIEKKCGMAFLSEREFLLSDNETHRVIYVFEKVGEPSVKLPRRVGMAQKKPLK